MKIITSAANLQIKELVKLKKAQARREKGLILVDGQRETTIALDNGWDLEKLYICPELNSSNLEERIDNNLLVWVSQDIFEKISYKEKPDGILAVLKEKKAKALELNHNENSLIIVLEGLEKPGNIGAIIRTASAVGASGIILNDCHPDIYNPNIIRASQGEVFTQKIATMTREETLKFLKNNQITTLAATTDAENSYFEQRLTGPVAIILGSEDRGLSREWQEAADIKVNIPMAGDIDSLNVSVAAAVIAFEVCRQRTKNA